MADEQQAGQQYDTSQLDTVEHPTLGTLKFPHAMPPEERNQMIEGMEKQHPDTKQVQQNNATETNFEKENKPSFWGEAARTAAKIPLKAVGFDTNSQSPVSDWIKQNAGYAMDLIHKTTPPGIAYDLLRGQKPGGMPKAVSDVTNQMDDLSREARETYKTGQSVEPAQSNQTGAFQSRPGGPIQRLGAPLEHPFLSAAVKEVASMVPVIGPGASRAGHALARATTPQETGEALADVGGVTGQGILATESGQKAANAAIEKVGGGINRSIVKPVTEGVGNLTSRLRTPAAQEALTQAAQPGVRIPKAQESFAIAGPRIQQIREAQGVQIPEKGPEAMKAVLDLNKEAKTQILQAIEDRMGPVAELRPDASSVAKGIRGSIDDLTVEQTPGLRESMERRAATYEKEGGWSIRQMENRMHTLNNRLANAYTQATPGEARISAETEMDLAEARELRKTIDSSVENLSGAGVKDLKREYGAQRDLEKALARQYAVATRVKGAPLWEGLAYLQAAGDVMSGNVLGAAKAAGTLMVGKRLQNLRDSGYLVNQAFHGKQAFEPAPPIPPHAGPPPPKALLTAPPTPAGYTPPADTSGSVRGGRYTTPKAQIEGEKPIEAEFVPRRVPTPPERAGINRMLPETAGPKTTIPPAVSPEFAREAIGVARQNPSAGVRVSPGSRELPAPAEMPKSGPPPSVSQRFAKEAIGSMENANRVGARGEQGTRFNEQALQSARRPIKGELPAPQGIKEIGVKHGLEYNPDMDKMTPTHYQFQDSVTGGSFSIPKKGFTEAKLVEALDKYRKSINVGDLSPTVSKKIGRTQERMAKEGQ